jgi:hypothetical protein
MRLGLVLTLSLFGCGGNDFYALPSPAADAQQDAPSGDDAAGDAAVPDTAPDVATDALPDKADASADADANGSDGGIAVCCSLTVYDAGAIEGCNPPNRFSCDLGDAGGWMGCTEALDQGTPCELGMKCRDTFDGVVVPCL